jgi:hypothetical protein
VKSLTTSQKIGLAVVAFCLTVAVTRRVQQEVDKEAVQASQKPVQAAPTNLDSGLWVHLANLGDGMHAFMCDSETGRTLWAVQLVNTDESSKVDYESLRAMYGPSPDGADRYLSAHANDLTSGKFDPLLNEVEVHRGDGAKVYFKIVKRLW